MNAAVLWTARWTGKLLDFLFWIGLRAALRGGRNLLRTSERGGAAGTEPRVRSVRQLAAAAGDGRLGPIGSPGQLETSLSLRLPVGPCNSYLEGPTPIFIWWLLAQSPLGLLLAQFLLGLLLAHRAQGIRRRRHSSRTKSVFAHRSSDRRARDLPTLAATWPAPSDPPPRDLADARSFVASSISDPAARDSADARSQEARFADARSPQRMVGSSAGSTELGTVKSGSGERQVPRIDPRMISGNPMRMPTVMGSLRTRAPSRIATAGLM
jgi:hypothetical protein